MTDRQLPVSIIGKLLPGVRISKGIILSTALLIGFGIFRYLLPERPLEYTGPRALSDHIFAVGLLIGVLLAGGGIGLKIIRWLRVTPLSYLETIVFAVPVGLGVIAYGILALGLLGLLETQYFVLWFAFLFFWSFHEWSELFLTGLYKFKRAFSSFKRINIGKKALLLAFILILTLTLFQALTPPWDYDGLMYHLQGPRIFLDIGRISPLPETWGANGPFTIEMLFMLGLRFGSDSFAKLLHMSYAVLLVIATFTFGRRFIGRQAGWIAAAILVAIPIFPMWASWAYADMAWAAYEFLSIYALILWIKIHRREWLVLSGILMGLALGSKYLALGSAGVLGLVVLWNSRKQGWKLVIQNAVIFGGVALLIASPWYIKNWLWTGNPVYPLYFGGLAWPAERVHLLMSYLNSFGTGHKVLDYLLLPWNIYVQNQRFATLLADMELPSFLFPLLLFFPFIRHKKIIHILAWIIILRLAVWAVGSHQIRFLLPAFPGLCLLTASMFVGADQIFKNKRIPRILQGGLIGGVVIVTLVFSVSLYGIQPLGVITGTASKTHFLSLMISDFRALAYIQKHIRQDERVFFMWDGQGYYCDERCLPDTAHSGWTLMAIGANYDVSKISSQLGDAGITHLLLTKDSDFILKHDPENQNVQAANFFLQQYREQCTDLVYSDNWSSLYKLKCK